MSLIISVLGATVIYVIYNKIRNSYFAFYDLVGGLPAGVTSTSVLLRLLIPFVVSVIIAIVLRWANLEIDNYARIGVGLLFGLILILPQLVNSELLPPSIVQQGKTVELYALYILLLLSFIMSTFFGFTIVELLPPLLMGIQPTWQGLVDNLWSGLIPFLLSWVISKLRKGM